MTFDSLEKRLKKENRWPEMSAFMTSLEGNSDYATTFTYLLAIGDDLQNAEAKYAIIGGYAVLLQLVKKVGAHSAKLWRGSKDLDLVEADFAVEHILGREYFTRSRPSHIADNKRTIDVTDLDIATECHADVMQLHEGKTVKLDGYELNKQFWNKIEFVDMYGVKFPVARAEELIKMKLEVQPELPAPRARDVHDIVQLLGALQMNGMDPQDLASQLSDFEKTRLCAVLSSPRDIQRMATIAQPSTSYQEKLTKVLRQ